MAKAVEFINFECAKCGVVELIMKIIDDIAMCPRCFHDEFGSDDPATLEPNKYKKWKDKTKFKVTDYRFTEDGVSLDIFKKIKIK